MNKGDIVYFHGDSDMLAEVMDIQGTEALVLLLKNDISVKASIYELVETNSFQPHRVDGAVVHILGIPYTIKIIEADDYRYNRDADGWCDVSVKEILIYNFVQDIDSKRDLRKYQNSCIRHEIIHAFLYESGLSSNSLSGGPWAKNEEMVDWMAIQAPKMLKAFEEAGVLEDQEG